MLPLHSLKSPEYAGRLPNSLPKCMTCKSMANNAAWTCPLHFVRVLPRQTFLLASRDPPKLSTTSMIVTSVVVPSPELPLLKECDVWDTDIPASGGKGDFYVYTYMYIT